MAKVRSLVCFVAQPLHYDEHPVGHAVRKAILDAGFRIAKPRDEPANAGNVRSTVEAIAMADCIVAELTHAESTIFFELGLAQALDKPSLLLTQQSNLAAVPVDLIRQGSFIEYQSTSDGLRDLSRSLTRALRDLRRFPKHSRLLLGARAKNLFVVDWERLTKEDVDNLCLELLTQLGFRRVEWEKEIPELDVIAELPKKDPDGFEYRELWMVSLGRNAPPEMLLDMLAHEPDYFFHRILRSNEKFGPLLKRSYLGDIPVTLLVIALHSAPVQTELFSVDERRRKYSPFGRLRVRIWDRNYLTGLVYQFPQIGFKYFSDEGRAQSKYRKTPEELYRENIDLTKRLTATVAALNDEKNKRVRAERDAVWKDISFSAAHKMGNPIFAIETNLDPLQRRIVDNRTSEAIRVVESIRNSIEKAKAIVAQFKSLTIAQQIKPVPTRLLRLLADACSAAMAEGVTCSVECPDDLQVLGDPERLGECFDELASNAMHWFDKAERKIEVRATTPSSDSVPDRLDSGLSYARVQFRDNGVGVPLDDKGKIFDAFYSTYHHGTGLGLALVRRIVEGHGGLIRECGIPGEGADFEMYLPLADCDPEALSSATNKSKVTKIAN